MDGDKNVRAVFAYNRTTTYTNDLPCIEDATIRPNSPQYNGNAVNHAYDQITFYDTFHAEDSLLKFDLSQLPTNPSISSLELHIYCDGRPKQVQRYEIQETTSDWSEQNIVGANPSCGNYDWGYGIANGENGWQVVNLLSAIPPSVNWISHWQTANYGLRQRWVRYYYDRGTTDDNSYLFKSRHGDNPPFLRVVYEGRRLVPLIRVDKTNVVAEVVKGTPPTNVIFTVSNVGEGTLTYSATPSTNWLVLSGVTNGSSTNVTNTKQFTLTLDASSLPCGLYQSRILVNDPNADNSPMSIPVTVTVLGPTISATPLNIAAETLQGANPASVPLNVWNSGAGALAYLLSNTNSWLTLTPSGGTSTGEVDSISVQFNASSLAAGFYTDTIKITDTNGWTPPVTIPVTLGVYTQQVQMPALWPPTGITYLTNVVVALSSGSSNAVVRYTLDKTMPTIASPIFSNGAVVLTSNTLLISRAWNTGMLSSGNRADGYVISPTYLTASHGTYPDRVRVTWPPVPGATGYEIFQNPLNNPAFANQIGTSGNTNYDDVVSVGTNFYWIVATNASGPFTSFSYSDSGWRQTVMLTTQANPTNAGFVAGGGVFTIGATALISAVASNNWLFAKWQDTTRMPHAPSRCRRPISPTQLILTRRPRSRSA
jgi:hypothetical protein